MSVMLVAPSAIATAIETSAIPRSISGDLPARASAGPSAPVSPALAVPGHFQRVVPARILHHEERSCREIAMVWLPLNLPEPGRSSLSGLSRCGGRRHRPCPVQPKVARSGLRLRVILRSPELPCESLPGPGPGPGRAGRMPRVTALAARVASPPGRAAPGWFEAGYPAGSTTAGHRAGRPGQESRSGESFGPTRGRPGCALMVYRRRVRRLGA
jgi:hypothetical protein